MFTTRHFPEVLPPSELDRYLARGWFRMGQTIFTCRFLIFDKQLYSAVWMRLALPSYLPTKSLRKIWRKNQNRFRVEFGTADITLDKEMLYQRYRTKFKGNISPNLKDSLMDGSTYNVFNTMESRVYDGDKLIAFSFFDLGNDSIESIKGVYHPDYAEYSLGIYTMLLEIDYGQRNHMAYYYPGYIVPGYPAFNYKTRFGKMDYFNPDTQKWYPFEEFDQYPVPAQLMQKKLAEMQEALAQKGIPNLIRLYPPYDLDVRDNENMIKCLEYPIFLQVLTGNNGFLKLAIIYDWNRRHYIMRSYLQYDDMRSYYKVPLLTEEDRQRICLDLYVEERTLQVSGDKDKILDTLQHIWR